MGDFIRNWVANMYKSAYENMLIRDKINEAMGNGTGSASLVTQKVMDFCIENIAPLFVSIGLALAVLFFLIQLVELGTSERLTLEYFIKFFTKLVVAVAVIAHCREIIVACVQFGNSMMNMVNGFQMPLEYTPDAMAAKVSEALENSEGSWIGILISAIFSIGVINLASMGITAIVYVISFTRVLELGVRGALMPVALGLMADDGWKGAGGRYIKKFIALCAQGGVLMVIGIISNIAMSAAATGGMANANDDASLSGCFVMLLGVSIATVSVLFKSMNIVNDVFGA